MNSGLRKNILEFPHFLWNEIKEHILIKTISILLIAFFVLSLRSYAAEGLGLSVDYDTNIKGGVPVTFTMNGTNGTGNYKYLFNSVYYQSYGTNMLVDPTRFYYSTDNQLEFTFYASGTYYMLFYVMDLGSTPIQTSRTVLTVTVSDPDYPDVDTVVRNVAAECAGKCTTDFEKAVWCHDWLLDHCVYDNPMVYCSAEGALCRGRGTCEAYYDAYSKLLTALSIENGRVVGNGHCWNSVKLDGNWYQVDVCWDDNGYSATGADDSYMYFGLTDELMQAVHSDHSPEAGRECNSLEDNFFIKSGRVKKWSETYTSTISEKVMAGATSFSITVSNLNYNDTIKNTLVAYDLSGRTVDAGENKEATLTVDYNNGSLNFAVSYKEKAPEEEKEKGMWVKLPVDENYQDFHIYIDGKVYEAEISNNIAKVSLDFTNGKIATMYSFNASGVPVGMKVWRLGFYDDAYYATELTGLENLLSYHGFSARIVGEAGLRFKSGISVDTKTRLKSTGIDGYKLTEYGNITMSASKLATNPLVKGGTGVKQSRSYYKENNVIKDIVFETVDGKDRFACVRTGLPAEAYNVNFAFRAYAILKDEAGTEVIVYGPVMSRSIYTVAKNIMNKNTYKPGSGGYIYLSGIISAVEQ